MVDDFKNITALYIEADSIERNINIQLMSEIGINVLAVEYIKGADEIFRHNKIDLILIDLNMHQQERMTFLQFVRYKDISSPVIIMADDSKKDILIQAINLDATRYLLKPLHKNELINTINNVVHKSIAPLPSVLTDNELNHGFSYDSIDKMIITPKHETLQLTKKEFLFIELLLKNKRHIVPFDEIERIVWQDSSMSIYALRTLVSSIRKKTHPDIITSYSGIGYKIE